MCDTKNIPMERTTTTAKDKVVLVRDNAQKVHVYFTSSLFVFLSGPHVTFNLQADCVAKGFRAVFWFHSSNADNPELCMLPI